VSVEVEREAVEESRGFDAIRERRDALSRMGEKRNDRLGAVARVLCALCAGECPTDADLISAGLPTPGQMVGQS
jgi:ferredoxin